MNLAEMPVCRDAGSLDGRAPSDALTHSLLRIVVRSFARSNRLSSILISFANLKNLVRLDVDDNPLSAFPDLSPCTSLKSLAFGCVSIDAIDSTDPRRQRVKVVTSFDRQQSSAALVINFWGAPKDVDPVQEFYDLALRGSTHHPLIIRGLAALIESAAMKKEFLKNAQALEKVALMLLSECDEVVTTACSVLGLLSEYDRQTADRILNSHGDILLGLCREKEGVNGVHRQVAGLKTMETITRFSSAADHHRLEEKLVSWALAMADGWDARCGDGDTNDGVGDQMKVTLLRTLGNLCCGSREGPLSSSTTTTKPPSWRDRPDFHAFVAKVGGLETDSGYRVSGPVHLSVKRLRSMLGLHGPPRHPGGVRVLSLDGGGMKGLATIRMLRAIEKATNRPLREMFDLVVGTSTGALLTVALMVRGFSLDECEAVYKEVGHKVFKHPVHSNSDSTAGSPEGGNGDGTGSKDAAAAAKATKAAKDPGINSTNTTNTNKDASSWASVFYRSLTSKTDSVRAARFELDPRALARPDSLTRATRFVLQVVVGCKHDTSTYEEILKERCSMESIGPYAIESMIDTSALDVPKIALVSALTSVSPVVPFIFRNYEYSRDAPADKTRVGSCSHAIWEAVRASSAATYYLDGAYLDRPVLALCAPSLTAHSRYVLHRFLSLSL